MKTWIGAARSYPTGWLTGGEQGQGMLEYALILGMVVLAIIAAFAFFDLSGVVQDVFSNVSEAIS